MLIGEGVFFGMILGGMASMLTNFDAQRARYTHRFNVIKQSLVGISKILNTTFSKNANFNLYCTLNSGIMPNITQALVRNSQRVKTSFIST